MDYQPPSILLAPWRHKDSSAFLSLYSSRLSPHISKLLFLWSTLPHGQCTHNSLFRVFSFFSNAPIHFKAACQLEKVERLAPWRCDNSSSGCFWFSIFSSSWPWCFLVTLKSETLQTQVTDRQDHFTLLDPWNKLLKRVLKCRMFAKVIRSLF